MRRMKAAIQFMVPIETKNRLWGLSDRLGLIPSQILREALIRELDRLEKTFDKDKNEPAGRDS